METQNEVWRARESSSTHRTIRFPHLSSGSHLFFYVLRHFEHSVFSFQHSFSPTPGCQTCLSYLLPPHMVLLSHGARLQQWGGRSPRVRGEPWLLEMPPISRPPLSLLPWPEASTSARLSSRRNLPLPHGQHTHQPLCTQEPSWQLHFLKKDLYPRPRATGIQRVSCIFPRLVRGPFLVLSMLWSQCSQTHMAPRPDKHERPDGPQGEQVSTWDFHSKIETLSGP